MASSLLLHALNVCPRVAKNEASGGVCVAFYKPIALVGFVSFRVNAASGIDTVVYFAQRSRGFARFGFAERSRYGDLHGVGLQ